MFALGLFEGAPGQTLPGRVHLVNPSRPHPWPRFLSITARKVGMWAPGTSSPPSYPWPLDLAPPAGPRSEHPDPSMATDILPYVRRLHAARPCHATTPGPKPETRNREDRDSPPWLICLPRRFFQNSIPGERADTPPPSCGTRPQNSKTYFASLQRATPGSRRAPLTLPFVDAFTRCKKQVTLFEGAICSVDNMSYLPSPDLWLSASKNHAFPFGLVLLRDFK